MGADLGISGLGYIMAWRDGEVNESGDSCDKMCMALLGVITGGRTLGSPNPKPLRVIRLDP